MTRLLASAAVLAALFTGAPTAKAQALNQTDLENIALVLLYDRDCKRLGDPDFGLTVGAKTMLTNMAELLFTEAERHAAMEKVASTYTRGRQRYEFCYAGQRMQLDERIDQFNRAVTWGKQQQKGN